MKGNIRHFLSKAITFCKSYIELCVWLLAFAVGIRFFEAILLSQKNHDFTSCIIWNLTGLYYDISLYLRISVWILIPFVAICFFSEKTARIILRILQSVMLLLSLICIVFFTTSGFLLDKVVFAYSIKDIIGIIQVSSKSPVWVYVVVVVLPALYFYLSGKRMKINNILLVAFACLTLSSFFIFNNLPLRTERYHVKVNKEQFLLKSIFKKQTSIFKENDAEMVKIIEEFRSYFPQHQFVEPEYPFLYKAECNDVLSPFFNLSPELPNFVFIIVEGLGYNFFKNDYQLMPFLDSLSKKSLLWEYCSSVAPRTFGVLPGWFGAAPLGETGFMSQCPNNPEHHTLLNILYQNNYTNSFFYSGNMDFDNMKYFFDENHTEYLKNDDWDQDITEQKSEIGWGPDDHLLFMQAHRKLDQITSSPRTDTYLTLSTHDPWQYPNSAHFQNTVENKVTQSKTLSDEQKNSVLKEIGLYGGYAYSDWALQQLIESYKKRDDFDNTIFFITGDHYPCPNQFGGYHNYNVPLIIYSPMLKAGRNMKGVVSHRDVTPTILSLLQNNYNVKTPEEVAWLNTALDTSLTFNAHTFSPLQLFDFTVGGIMYKNYFFCEGVLEELTDDTPRKIDDKTMLQQMERMLFLYQTIETYILYNDALLKNKHKYKRKQTEVVINIEDTIAQESYFAKDSKLRVVKGPEGHETTLYIDSTNVWPITFLYYKVPHHDIEKFMVEIEFKIYVKNDDKNKDIRLGLALMKNNESEAVINKGEYFEIDRHNRWYTYKKMMICKKETFADPESDYVFKVFIWNLCRLEAYLDDIKVKVTATNDNDTFF